MTTKWTIGRATMITVQTVLLAGAMLAGTGSQAGVIFQDDFSSTPTNLNQWNVVEGTPTIASGVLSMNPPAADPWATTLTTTASWSAAGKYELTVVGFANITNDAYRFNSRVTMPGGLELRYYDWGNGAQVWYQGIYLNADVPSVWHTMTPYKMVQVGRAVEVYVNGTLGYSGTVTTDPDFATYGKITLYDKYGAFAEYDSVSLSYSIPEPASLVLLAAAGGVWLFRRRRN